MKKPKQFYQIMIAAFVLLGSADLFAQFTLTGELRPRTEFRNGFKRPKDKGDDPAFFIEQRSRLYFDYTLDKISMSIALQDIRMWGSTDQVYKSDPTLQNVYEAWAKYAFSEVYSVQIGRQAMDYDNARFLGDLDWAQQGRSHDALLFTKKHADRNCQLDVAFAYNQRIPFEPGRLEGNEYFGVNNYKTMIFGHWSRKFEDGSVAVLFHNDGQQVASDTSVAHRQTYGVLGDYKIGEVKLAGEFYYQGGHNSLDTKVNGLFVALHGTLSTDITPLTLGFEYLSGTARGEDNDKSFNPLYGPNHKFYGFMDYFYVGNYHGQAGGGRTSGLIDVHLKTNFKFGQNSSLAANLHYFTSPVKIYEGFGTNGDTYSSTLGTEIDLVYSLSLSQNVKFNLGYSQMFATEAMEAVKGGGDASAFNNWMWAMIAFKPQLFSTAKE
jgi:hypothetical protein